MYLGQSQEQNPHLLLTDVIYHLLLDKFDLKQYFHGIYSGSDLGITKKDGTGYLKVIEIVGGCNKPLILEDAVHAIIGATSQKLDVLAILDYSNKNHLDIVNEYATYLINLEDY